MWMLPLYLHVSQKSDYDNMIMVMETLIFLSAHNYTDRSVKTSGEGDGRLGELESLARDTV